MDSTLGAASGLSIATDCIISDKGIASIKYKKNSFHLEADVVRENFGDKIARLVVWNVWANFLKGLKVDGQQGGVYDPVGEFDLLYKNDLQKLYGLDLTLPTDVETQLYESLTIMNTALFEILNSTR